MAKAENDIIVCRCEDVTLGEIRKAIKEGATTIDEVKRITRAGMGPCQGRTCRLLVAGEIARYLGKPVSEILQSRYLSLIHILSMTSVPPRIARWLTAKSTPSGRGLKEIAAISEERAIQHAMEQAGPGRGQVERAARILGISRATLYRRLKK